MYGGGTEERGCEGGERVRGGRKDGLEAVGLREAGAERGEGEDGGWRGGWRQAAVERKPDQTLGPLELLRYATLKIKKQASADNRHRAGGDT